MFTFELIMYPRALIWWNPPSTTHTQFLQNQLYLTSLLIIFISHFLWSGQQGKRSADTTSALRAPTPFPCVSRNNFYMHSPCSYFAVLLIGEGGRRSDNSDGGNCSLAVAPHPVSQGRERSTEGDAVSASCPGGKGHIPQPGLPPIYGRRQRRQQPWKGG